MPRARKAYHRDQTRDGIALEHLPSGNWRARVWDRTLRRYRSVTRKTEGDAKTAGEELQARFTLGTDNAAPCTIDAIWKAYRDERLEDGKAKSRTMESMQRVVDGLRESGATSPKAPGFRGAVAGYFRRLELTRSKAVHGRAAVSTRKRMLSQVRALLNFARTAGWLVADPLAGFQAVGSREQDDTTREVFSVAEARRLVALDRASDPVWIHAVLCLFAGLRDAEARAVTWEDYREEQRVLWVRKGKGNKARAVIVQPELAVILDAVAEACGPKANKSPCLPMQPIARPAKGRGLASYSLFLRLLKDAGINRDRGVDPITEMPRCLTRHALRHTYCAAMLATGEPGVNLRIMMGHGSEDLTAHYGAQVTTYRAQVEREGWDRGQLHFRTAPRRANLRAASID